MYCLIFAFLLTEVSSDVVINTNSGPIRGTPSLDDNVEAYLGIPYAEPPVGDLRFAKPIPKRKWADVYNASVKGPPCLQFSLKPYYFLPDISNMSEDCLYLNVWAPKSEPTYGLRPIIIFIHHGAYSVGSSTTKVHDGSHLAAHGDVVIASFNFRLGVFGYFLAYTEEANGNMGEFDKILAMEWIKENSKYFHGDPENISIMGASSGAYSVSGLMVSPIAQDLFRRVIILSGSMINPFFLDDNAKLFKNSQTVASVTGCSNGTITLKSDPRSVVNCLKNKSGEDLVEAQRTLSLSNPMGLFPRVNDEYLPKTSIELYREGKFSKEKDMFIGITKNEGTMMLFVGVPEYVGMYGKEVKDLTKYRALALSRGSLLLTGLTNTAEILDYYMKHVKSRETFGYLNMISNIVGDFVASCGTIFNADIVSLKGNRVFFYKLEFRPASTPTAEWVGTTHLDELQYIFGNPYHQNFTAEEMQLSHTFMERLAAFARKG